MSVDDNSLCDPKVTSLLIGVAFYGKEQLVKFKFLDGAISSESGLSKTVDQTYRSQLRNSTSTRARK